MRNSDSEARKLGYEELVEILSKPPRPPRAPTSDVFATVMSHFLADSVQPIKNSPVSEAPQMRKALNK